MAGLFNLTWELLSCLFSFNSRIYFMSFLCLYVGGTCLAGGGISEGTELWKVALV